MREHEKRQARLLAAMTGATALVFDLAWIAWKMGCVDLEGGVEELDDVGALIERLAGTNSGAWPAGSGGTGPT